MGSEAFDGLRSLPRESLEAFAIKALIQIRQDRKDKVESALFAAVLSGFALGALLAASGFMIGMWLR